MILWLCIDDCSGISDCCCGGSGNVYESGCGEVVSCVGGCRCCKGGVVLLRWL